MLHASTQAHMDTKKLSKLNNLPLTEEDEVKWGKEIEKEAENIVSLFGQIKDVNTSHVKPTYNVTGLKNVFREDIVKPNLTREEALKNVHNTRNGYFIFNELIEKGLEDEPGADKIWLRGFHDALIWIQIRLEEKLKEGGENT